MDHLAFDHIAWLLALPLAALPFMNRLADVRRFSWIALLPWDRLAEWIARLQKLFAALAIATIVIGLSAPYRSSVVVERVGLGSEIALLLDRSRSMDQPFIETPHAINPYYQETRRDILDASSGDDAKGKIARRVLAEFAAGRPHDLISYSVFSSFPIPVLHFTQNHDMLQAAIAAGDVGKGLADTDIGGALLAAALEWRDRPWRGTRAIVLVSDGGAQLDTDMRQRLAYELRRNRIGVNFLYIRSYNSHSLKDQVADDEVDKIPELSLHKFLGGIGVTYHAYEAENGKDLKRAVQDIGERENAAIIYNETLPRRDYSSLAFRLALLSALGWLLTLLPEWIAVPWLSRKA